MLGDYQAKLNIAYIYENGIDVEGDKKAAARGENWQNNKCKMSMINNMRIKSISLLHPYSYVGDDKHSAMKTKFILIWIMKN